MTPERPYQLHFYIFKWKISGVNMYFRLHEGCLRAKSTYLKQKTRWLICTFARKHFLFAFFLIYIYLINTPQRSNIG